MTRDDLLEAITAACQPQLPASDPGYTVGELRAYWSRERNIGMGAARARIKAAVEAGKLVTGQRWRIDAAGRCVADQVYRAA